MDVFPYYRVAAAGKTDAEQMGCIGDEKAIVAEHFFVQASLTTDRDPEREDKTGRRTTDATEKVGDHG